MIQCKSCGATVADGTLKCKFCGCNEFTTTAPAKTGTKPPARPQKSTACSHCGTDLFGSPQWAEDYRTLRASSSELCLVLTNTRELGDCTAFHQALENYVHVREAAGIRYCVLDLANQAVCPDVSTAIKYVVEILREVYKVAVPDYLLILGDHKAVPSQIWRNEGDTYDTSILSDLPYITLDLLSPWRGVTYDFTVAVPAGRVPASAAHNFSEAVEYLNFLSTRTPADTCKAFAYTAASWEPTSRNAFAPVSAHLECSPPNTISSQDVGKQGYQAFAGIDPSYNLLCYNLHGGSTTNLWIGESLPNSQGRSVTTVAFHPSYFPRTEGGYVVCTEACYGANPLFSDDREVSALNYALSNRCICFVGSTRVAWGTGNGTFYGADVVATHFSRLVANGLTVGDAYLLTMHALVTGRSYGPDEKEIKTMAEFGLYGDPSVTLIAGAHAAKTTAKGSMKRRANVATEDPSRAVSLLSCHTDGYNLTSFGASEKQEILMKAERIAAACQKHLTVNFAFEGDTRPQVYKVVGQSGYRAYVSHETNGDWGGMCFHYDDDCNLLDVFMTK